MFCLRSSWYGHVASSARLNTLQATRSLSARGLCQRYAGASYCASDVISCFALSLCIASVDRTLRFVCLSAWDQIRSQGFACSVHQCGSCDRLSLLVAWLPSSYRKYLSAARHGHRWWHVLALQCLHANCMWLRPAADSMGWMVDDGWVAI